MTTARGRSARDDGRAGSPKNTTRDSSPWSFPLRCSFFEKIEVFFIKKRLFYVCLIPLVFCLCLVVLLVWFDFVSRSSLTKWFRSGLILTKNVPSTLLPRVVLGPYPSDVLVNGSAFSVQHIKLYIVHLVSLHRSFYDGG